MFKRKTPPNKPSSELSSDEQKETANIISLIKSVPEKDENLKRGRNLFKNSSYILSSGFKLVKSKTDSKNIKTQTKQPFVRIAKHITHSKSENPFFFYDSYTKKQRTATCTSEGHLPNDSDESIYGAVYHSCTSRSSVAENEAVASCSSKSVNLGQSTVTSATKVELPEDANPEDIYDFTNVAKKIKNRVIDENVDLVQPYAVTDCYFKPIHPAPTYKEQQMIKDVEESCLIEDNKTIKSYEESKDETYSATELEVANILLECADIIKKADDTKMDQIERDKEIFGECSKAIPSTSGLKYVGIETVKGDDKFHYETEYNKSLSFTLRPRSSVNQLYYSSEESD